MDEKLRRIRAAIGARQLAFHAEQIRKIQTEIVIERVQKAVVKRPCK